MKRFLCAFITGVAVFCGNCFADDNWTANTIDNSHAFDKPTVVVDIDNLPIVIHSRYPGSPLYILNSADNYEPNQIPDTIGAAYPSFEITSNSELAISFLKSGEGLWYGGKSSWFDWVFSKVADFGNPYVDMDLAHNDIPHIAYSYSESIYHAFYDVHSQQWIKEQLSDFSSPGPYNLNIDVAHNDKIMISCSDKTYIGTASYSDGFWSYLPMIASSVWFDGAFTPDGLPAVAFVRSNQLIYAVYINDVIGWVETVIAPVIPPSGYYYSISLAHSTIGAPGIAYIDGGKLMYATNIAGGWTTTLIDEMGFYPDLIFDRNDKPLVVYTGWDECMGVGTLNLAGIGLEPFNMADLNNDKIVNFKDFAVMADYWMAILPQPDLTIGDFDQNAKVDALDLRWLACNWLWGNSGQ